MKNHEIKENQDKTPDEQSAPETSPKAGKRVFWRPFLVAAGAVLLLILIAPLIPANENSIFSIKKFDLLAKLKGTGETTELDSVVVAARELQIDDELQALEPFLHKIHDFQKGSGETLRIAFYGDSIIEGDLLTETLRARLQEEYGGHGVGLVPPNHSPFLFQKLGNGVFHEARREQISAGHDRLHFHPPHLVL